MTLTIEYQQIIDKLYSSYLSKGFLHENETLKVLSEGNVSFKDTDRLIGILLSKGVIFSSGIILNDEDSSDYGFINYNDIYNEVIKIDKNLKVLIAYIKNIMSRLSWTCRNLDSHIRWYTRDPRRKEWGKENGIPAKRK